MLDGGKIGLYVVNNKVDVREKLLDVAEELFAYNGLNGVSIRQITTKAEVRLASVNYYFDSKDGLFLEVMMRRVSILKEHRMMLLAAIDVDLLTTDEALARFANAFVYPLLEKTLEGGVGWRNYCRLVSNSAAMNVEKPAYFERYCFDEVAIKFNSKLKQILPGISDRNCFYAYQFMVGATQYIFSRGKRLDLLSKGKYQSNELDKICSELVLFIASGLKGLAAPGKPEAN